MRFKVMGMGRINRGRGLPSISTILGSIRWHLVLGTGLILTLICLGTGTWRGSPKKAPIKCGNFGVTQAEDVQKILSYPLDAAIPYYKTLLSPVQRELVFEKGLEGTVQHTVNPTAPRVPVLITAGSSNHFQESLHMVENVNRVARSIYKDMTFYYYDLGLTAKQRKRLESTCNCTVRDFPFETLPKHVSNLHNYAWKPIIIQLVMREHPFVLYADASFRLYTSNLTATFEKAKSLGIMAASNKGLAVASHALFETFKFLGEEPCLYRQAYEFEGSPLLLYGSEFMLRYFMLPWVSCALIPTCMAVDDWPESHLACGSSDQPRYHQCHRFDQSVYNILLHRLFHSNIDSHTVPADFHQTCRAGSLRWYQPSFMAEHVYQTTVSCFPSNLPEADVFGEHILPS